MASVTIHEDKLLRPLLVTTRKYWILLGVLLAGVVWFAYAWITQLSTGLVMTGMRDIPAGAAWGVYITNFVFWIGISHAGIAISAAIRLLGLKDYAGVGRLAEMITVFSLAMAGLSIIMDMGRPDRIFNIITAYSQRLPSSPLVWDITAVGTYFISSITYLYLELREDLAKLLKRVRWGWLYKLLLPGYTPGERGRIERVIWWASVFILAIMVMVHTTVAWIFGLMVGRPGWYSPLLAPYYVLGAILSGIAAVVVVTFIYRKVFNWQEVIPAKVYRGLGRVLCWFSILYLYFLLSEFLTVSFAGPVGELNIYVALRAQEFAWLYWLQVAVLAAAFIVFFINTVFPKVFRVWTTVAAAAGVVITLWATRFLIIIPSLIRPFLPYPQGSYTPTWIEWSLVGGTFVLVALFYTITTKVFPMVSLTELERAAEEEAK